MNHHRPYGETVYLTVDLRAQMLILTCVFGAVHELPLVPKIGMFMEQVGCIFANCGCSEAFACPGTTRASSTEPGVALGGSQAVQQHVVDAGVGSFELEGCSGGW